MHEWSGPKLISLPKIPDPRGNLSFFESGKHIPFKILRTYLIYDVPGGEIRGGHAFRKQQEFIVALSGSFDVVIQNPDRSATSIQLNRSYKGLYLPNLLWRHMENFSTNAVCLVVSSELFDPADYIREFDEFVNLAG